MNVTCRIDNMELISSGTIQYSDDQELSFKLDDIEDVMCLKFEFIDDSPNTETKVSIVADKSDNTKGVIQIINFKYGPFPGVLPTMHLGDISNNDVYIGLSILRMGIGKPTLITYSYYIKYKQDGCH